MGNHTGKTLRIRELDAGGIRIEPPASSRTASPAHVSNIIRDILNTLYPGTRNPYDDLSPSEKQRLGNYASVGWAWEEIIRRGILDAGWMPGDAGRYISAGEMELDGIYGTPDWFDATDWSIVEFKATWRSSRRPLDPDFWHWLVQIKSYCRMAGTQRAVLYVFFVNGDYRESGPELRAMVLEFTELELQESWEMMVQHAKSKGWI